MPESVTEPVPVPDLAKPERVQLPTARAHATESPVAGSGRSLRLLAEPTPATPVDEAELLMRAHAALQRGDAAQALSLVAEHEALPGAKLGQERERIAIEALLCAGAVSALPPSSALSASSLRFLRFLVVPQAHRDCCSRRRRRRTTSRRRATTLRDHKP